MQGLMSKVKEWQREELSLAVAVVTATWGSSPRPVGSRMIINQDLDMVGSVSGGCVEGAVVEAAEDVIQSGQPRLLEFGVTDEDAWKVGLACGGQIEVFLRPLEPSLVKAWWEIIQQGMTAVTVTVTGGSEAWLGRSLVLAADGELLAGKKLNPELREGLESSGRRALQVGESGRDVIPGTGKRGPVQVFANLDQAPLALIAVGGVHITVPLVSLAKTLGFRTVVIDPRRLFGSEDRFPAADQLLQVWPQEAIKDLDLDDRTAVALLTHDPKIDDPALIAALDSDAFYIGALGSSRTQVKRRRRMVDQGYDQHDLDRIHGPIGLDLGGRSAEEIALAIMAEIISVWNQAPSG